MPRIVMKRSDVPEGLVQVVDLIPNTSQKSLSQIYQPVGQSKYIRHPKNDVVATADDGGVISLTGEARGLAAWLVTNVNDGTGDFAEGTFTIAIGDVTAGETVTVDATAVGGPSVVFTFVDGAPTAPNEVQGNDGDHEQTATNLAAAINNPANGLDPYVSAAAATNVVTVTAVEEGTASNSIALSDTGANITTVDMAGGLDADALSAAQVNAAADDILALVAYGDATAAASPVTEAAVNGELPGGSELTEGQLQDLLDVLAGREYVVPAGTIVETGSAFGVEFPEGSVHGFVEGTLRNVYSTFSLQNSVSSGNLSKYLRTDFTYGDAEGDHLEALVVYNDDGSLYTP